MAKKFGDDPGTLDDLVDFAPERGHADWRNDLLSFLLYSPEPEPESVVMALRRAV